MPGPSTVPWTDILADIAAEDVVPDAGTHFCRDLPAFFDGQIRNAARGIELVGLNQRVRGTRLNAARAASAAVRRRQVRLKIERGQNHAQENPRAQLLVEDAGVLADPADAGVFGIDALDQRSGVYITTGRDLRRAVTFSFRPDALFHLPQPAHDGIVIVFSAPGIAGDPATGLVVRYIGGIRLRGVVVNAANNDGPRPGNRRAQGSALQFPALIPRLQVFHFAGVAGFDPGRKVLQLGESCFTERSHTAKLKAGLAGGVPGDLGDVLHEAKT